MEERNVDTKRKSPKQGLTNAKDLPIERNTSQQLSWPDLSMYKDHRVLWRHVRIVLFLTSLRKDCWLYRVNMNDAILLC